MKTRPIPQLFYGLAFSLVAFVTIPKILVVLLLVRTMTHILGVLGQVF